MKKLLYLFLLILVTSCYKQSDIPDYPFPEYLGNWNNTKTTVNGIPDDIYPFNKVPHYVFQIAQSEVMLPYDRTLGKEYQYWGVDKTTTPYRLLLYAETKSQPPTIIFLITKEPYQGKMELTYQDSIVYYLTK
jgi:hypothetical protein